MKFLATTLLAASILAGAATSASAQTVDTLDRRLTKIEKEVRAVQRTVFPGGDDQFFEPEVVTQAPGAAPDPLGAQAATPGVVLTERINSLESQIQTLTGQVEEMENRLRQMETRFESFESDTKFRLNSIEGNPTAASEGGTAPTDPVAAARAKFNAGDYAEAQAALQAYLDANASSPEASEAGFWLGRSLLAQDQPVQAVQTLLENYQERREGKRAADSLLWVGRSLMKIEPPRADRACQAYDRLEEEYKGKLSDEVVSGLVEARLEASCS